MRLSKIPIPLLVAALVVTTAVVVYLQLTVVRPPPIVDQNFTGTLVVGTSYLWRGAASEFTFTSNATIKLSYMQMGDAVYLNGPPANITLGPDKWLIYLSGGRPILIEKINMRGETGNVTVYYAFNLVKVSSVNNLTIYAPYYFSVEDTLTPNEIKAIVSFTGAQKVYRVVTVSTDGLYIAVTLGDASNAEVVGTDYYALPPAMNGTSFKLTFSGRGVSYVVNGVTRTAYILPYVYFVITPTASASLSISVK